MAHASGAHLPPCGGRATARGLSGGGTRLAFISDRSGDKHVWVIAPDGGEARQLTSGALVPSEGAWSPDGRWLAVVGKPRPATGAAESDVRVISRLRYKNDGEGFWDGKWKQGLGLPAGGGGARQI